MNPRKEFLLALFQTLEERKVPYVVVRNYDDIFESSSSDVDLAVEPEELNHFIQCLAETALATGHVEVLRARYVNHSYVYFHAQGGFLRIDIETETRWRIFPILSAKAIVGLRRKHEEFYIPHPRHESVILFAASIWRGFVSERYRTQLSRLYALVKDREKLGRSYRAIFGRAGDLLADYQSGTRADLSPPLTFNYVKKSLILNALRTGPNRRAMIHYLGVDLRRFFNRMLHPPGISLLFTSSAKKAWDIRVLLERIEFLYPVEKTDLHQLERSPSARLTWKLRRHRWWTLFKGGLFIRFYQTHNDDEIPQIIGTHSRYIYPSRTFVCNENSRNQIVLAHVGTGLMAQFESKKEELSQGDNILGFIAGILNRNGNSVRANDPGSSAHKARGVFIVLLGLDGSGKTTIARELCCLASATNQFEAIRYFHWRPGLVGQGSLPLPSTTNVARKPSLQAHPFRSLISTLRLFKNLALTRLAWRLKVQKLMRRKTLVIIDRYFYNYYLDPVSVRYYGPSSLVDKVRPAFPRPDLIVVLKAPAATLRARKQELSEEQIHQQSAVLQQIALDSPQSMVVDATRPAAEIAREVLARIETLTHLASQESRSP